jgi:hypothetical protein
MEKYIYGFIHTFFKEDIKKYTALVYNKSNTRYDPNR